MILILEIHFLKDCEMILITKKTKDAATKNQDSY